MSSYLQTFSYFFRLPWHVQWRTFLVQLPRYVPLSILHITSPKGPHPFVIALPSRKNAAIPIYVFLPPGPVDLRDNRGETLVDRGEWKVPVVLDFHGGGFIMGSPLEQAPYASMMARELGAVVISVSYRIGPFHQFPAAIHDAEDVLSAILDTDRVSKAGKVLRTEIQRYYSMMRSDALKKNKSQPNGSQLNDITTFTLDPTRLVISGFSAGGNIALNMAISVPPCAQMLPQSPRASMAMSRSPADTLSPLLPPSRAPTKLDDPCQPWPSILPPPQAQPRMLPLLLFYPSLDARLLPHERPMKHLPNALKPHDKKPQQQKTPGLFSIMGPTYLPKKLRGHPRASPGLVDPDNFQKNAAIFLVLPERDSLAVQSDVWVDQMNSAGWNGPVRFGDGRPGDYDGRDGGPELTEGHQNGGLEVWHAPGCRHGWTQFPETILGTHEKKERQLVFARTLDFVKENWRKRLPPEPLGNRSQELRPLEIPAEFEGLN
ncbi:alpha/beta-hydrolase [Trematosphaeria pertusa]|uniref:Alpha/beta-hydrolase n=1 Tax=Trematosphaeria pertusa TaxID=390896 RepID=A0A6A6IVS0_9PLEO|nr:alpha/beta-hydrolase [Trematosphaeria pertusa]KAF2254651.1 alpha/beta-hydrolase [Trematosphaeria pertusa]